MVVADILIKLLTDFFLLLLFSAENHWATFLELNLFLILRSMKIFLEFDTSQLLSYS